MHTIRSFSFFCFFALIPALCAQSDGTVRGVVTLLETGKGLQGAVVSILEIDRSTATDENGVYEINGVPPGAYHVVAHMGSAITEGAESVTIAAGEIAVADFALELTVLKHEITVTAGGREETAFESFQSVDSLDAFDLNEQWKGSLGESLDQRVGTGIAKRSFGPGSSRPIVRGFDGDRVLIMKDGVRTGTLSAQSGDHGELMNLGEMDRVEVVKGPATLLYGGSAMGGTVNAISRHHDFSQHAHRHDGMRGFITGSGGTANAMGGASGGFEYGSGKWMAWGSVGGMRSGDYSIPGGEQVFNSRTWSTGGRGGFGYYGDRYFFSVEAGRDDGENGIPFAHEFEAGGEDGGAGDEEAIERISIDARRWSLQGNWGVRELGPAIESFTLKLSYTDWRHNEVEYFEDGASEVATQFDNDQIVYRGQFEQRRKGRLSGRFGFWGISRDFDSIGEEALAPPVDQTAFALFALEEIEHERFRFQFGGRIETNRYDPTVVNSAPTGGGEGPEPIRRTFTGASASAGARAELWKGGAFLANYYHTNRAPALEELYNFGPHIGNLAFEIGDPTLKAEKGNGLDLSLRHDFGRTRTTLNYFYYDFNDFVFPFDTGRTDDGLRVIEFTQLDARFTGAEAKLDFELHPNLWLNLAGDYVNARSKTTRTPLPRIPPLRAKAGLDFHWGSLTVRPELIIANQQHLTFTSETRTPGYVVWNLTSAYTIARATLVHQLALSVFNLGDRLYRNHSSFIKDLAPEIGRGVRMSYTVRFF